MKRRRLFLSAPFLVGAAIIATGMGGCVSAGSIQVGKDGKPVADRIAKHYNAYVTADTAIDEGERTDRLRSMRLLQRVLDQAAELGN